MKRWFRLWWFALFLVAAPISYSGWQRWQFWNDYERIVIWDSWTVALPRGGSVTYRNQSPRSRPVIGPADSQKFLLWQRPDGRTHDYPISNIGGGYSDLEVRLRPDGQALWLISWDWKKVVATLDLKSGRFTGEGSGAYDWNFEGQDESASGELPKWAKMNSGRSLGRKHF